MTLPRSKQPFVFQDALTAAEQAANAQREPSRPSRASANGEVVLALIGIPGDGELLPRIDPQALADMYAHEAGRDGVARHVASAADAARPIALRLSPNLSAEDLHRLRRQIALEHHPDRVPPALRKQATQRMTEANALIDEALATRRTR